MMGKDIPCDSQKRAKMVLSHDSMEASCFSHHAVSWYMADMNLSLNSLVQNASCWFSGLFLFPRAVLDGQHQNQIDYILCSQGWRSSIQSAKTRLGADCGSDHELLIAKFRLKLKKVGKTARPFRYDLNQIPYDYTVEVQSRFKGLDLIYRMPEELWMEICDTV